MISKFSLSVIRHRLLQVAGVECVTEENPSTCLPNQFECTEVPNSNSTTTTTNTIEEGNCISRSSVCDDKFDCEGVV